MRNSGTRGYSGYRGRRPSGKNYLAILLAAILLAAVGFLFAQRYRVYHTDGTSHYELPWQRAREEAGAEPELEIVIENPDGTETAVTGG